MPPRRNASRLLRVATPLAAALLLITAVAFAATQKSTKTLVFHAAGTASPKCAKGERPLLGGFSTTLSNLGPYVHPSALTVSGRKLNVSAVNEQRDFEGGTGSATAIAYCGSGPKPTTVSASKTLAPDGVRGQVVAKCPSGSSVALGGFRSDIATDGQHAEVYVDNLERVSPRKWRVGGINDGSVAGQIEAIAYCTPGNEQLTTVTHAIQIQPMKTGTVTAKCPAGHSLVMGGVRSQHYGSGYGALQLRSIKRKGARGWQVGALKFEALIGKLTAVAYCR